MENGIILVWQHWWGSLIAGYLFLGGLAGLALPIAYYYWIKERNKVMSAVGSLIAFIGIILGLFLLVIDLKRPEKAYLALASPALNWKSWMTIGTYIISLYTIFSGLYALPFIVKVPSPRVTKYPTVIGAIATFLGVATAVYTGFLLGAIKSITFWNTPILPVLFVVSGLSAGLCIYCAVSPAVLRLSKGFEKHAARIRLQLQRLDAYSLMTELFLLFVYLDTAMWGDTGMKEAAKSILYGNLAPYFWILVVVVGTIIPLILLFGYTLRIKEESKTAIAISVIAAILILIGSFTLRYVILKAGVIQISLI